MKIKKNVFLFFILLLPGIGLSQKSIISYSAEIGYSNYGLFNGDIDTGFGEEERPFRPCFSMGNRMELDIHAKNFCLETGISFSRVRFELIRKQIVNFFTTPNGTLLDEAVIQVEHSRRLDLISILFSLNINLKKSKIKLGTQALFALQHIRKDGVFIFDNQGNQQLNNIFFLGTPPEYEPSIYVETFIEFSHKVYENTWLKLCFYDTFKSFDSDLETFSKNRFTIGFTQYIN